MKSTRAFTLIELLVAVAIFAVLSAMGWKVFDYISKVKERNAQHEQRLSHLQHAYQQILRDTLQIAPLNASVNLEPQAALTLNNGQLIFSKTGVTDPLQQGISPTERVEYRYDQQQQKLYRLKYASIHQVGNEQPSSSVLLDQVQQFNVVVLNPEPQTLWPSPEVDTQDLKQLRYLPKGVQIKLTVNDIEYEWIYSLLNTDFLKPNEGGLNPNQKDDT